MPEYTFHLFLPCRSAVKANDRNAEQKMTFVDDTKQFQDCSMPVLHDSIWEK